METENLSVGGEVDGAETGGAVGVGGAADVGGGFVSNDDEVSLVPRLLLIEDQPLETRAAAFVQIHDALQQQLAGADIAASGGSVANG